jgi:hypothetical protein
MVYQKARHSLADTEENFNKPQSAYIDNPVEIKTGYFQNRQSPPSSES